MVGRATMKVGLIDVDGHNFPNLPLMKLSAFHKSKGDDVEMLFPMFEYDKVYMSKVFDFTPDYNTVIYANEIIKGGTGYIGYHNTAKTDFLHGDFKYPDGEYMGEKTRINGMDGRIRYLDKLPNEIEHQYPDYSLYNITDTAYGFLTRGCPRACDFCIVAEKEGRKSIQVAELSEFWKDQKYIELLDPNLLACKNHITLLKKLKNTGRYVNLNQGIDARLLTEENALLLKDIKTKSLHFAWDYMKYENMIVPKLEMFKKLTQFHYRKLMVYVLTNFDTTHEEDLYRVEKLKDMGYDPYVMIYDKENAPRQTRLLQRYANNKIIFRACKSFDEYDRKIG